MGRKELTMRKAGILLPITSLPSEYGIGAFTESAYSFVDFLERSGQSYWQILPIGPTSFGDSPYQSPSAFAGNPYMISLKKLAEDGLLEKHEFENADFGDTKTDIDYEKLYNTRYIILKKAFSRFNTEDSRYQEFLKNNEFWLFDYAFFMSLKGYFGEKTWQNWPDDIAKREPDAMARYINILKDEIEFWQFLQYEFFEEWLDLKKYANEHGIKIIGDMPIYTAMDSSDVWQNPELFQLDENLSPIAVAGCPPDGFSWEGQLWGNPLYDWEEHKKQGYNWWIKRISHCQTIFDMVRIDHFRGFDEYYAIPYPAVNAVHGAWEKGPGIDLFNALGKFSDKDKIIAEDLGFITDSVKKLLADTGFSGIKVLEFAFDSRDENAKNDYLPHNYPENSVCYTGTHDNQTLLSWLKTIQPDEQRQIRDYICDYYTPLDELNIPLISLVLRSSAEIAIIPIQDYMSLDDSARINTPSTLGTNWRWRLLKDQLTDDLSRKILKMTRLSGR